jgi:hypothetical protein
VKSKRAKKDGLLSNQQLNEVKRRALLICNALDSGNDTKVDEIAIESIKRLDDVELLVLGDFVEKHGFFELGEQISQGNLSFFDPDDEEI